MMALAMGAENTVFERDGEIQIGLTYMIGALVQLGERLATALRSGNRLGWLSYLMLWLGLVGGAVAGATICAVAGLGALWLGVRQPWCSRRRCRLRRIRLSASILRESQNFAVLNAVLNRR